MNDLVIVCDKNDVTAQEIYDAFEQMIDYEYVDRAEYKIKIVSSGDFRFGKCAKHDGVTPPEPFVDMYTKDLVITSSPEAGKAHERARAASSAGDGRGFVTTGKNDHVSLTYGTQDGKFRLFNGSKDDNSKVQRNRFQISKIGERFVLSSDPLLVSILEDVRGTQFEESAELPHDFLVDKDRRSYADLHFTDQKGNDYKTYHQGEYIPLREVHNHAMIEEFVDYILDEQPTNIEPRKIPPRYKITGELKRPTKKNPTGDGNIYFTPTYLVDETGKQIGAEYENMEHFFHGGYIEVKKPNGYWTLVNEQGEEMDCDFQSVKTDVLGYGAEVITRHGDKAFLDLDAIARTSPYLGKAQNKSYRQPFKTNVKPKYQHDNGSGDWFYTLQDGNGNDVSGRYEHTRTFADGYMAVQKANGLWTFVKDDGSEMGVDFVEIDCPKYGKPKGQLPNGDWMDIPVDDLVTAPKRKTQPRTTSPVVVEYDEYSPKRTTMTIPQQPTTTQTTQSAAPAPATANQPAQPQKFPTVRPTKSSTQTYQNPSHKKKFKGTLTPQSLDNGMWTFVDEDGKRIDATYSDVHMTFSEGFAGVQKANGNWTFIDGQGEEVGEEYLAIDTFRNGKARVQTTDGDWKELTKAELTATTTQSATTPSVITSRAGRVSVPVPTFDTGKKIPTIIDPTNSTMDDDEAFLNAILNK